MLLVGTINTTVVTLLPSSTCSATIGNHEFYLNQKYLANALDLMFPRERHQLRLLRASKGRRGNHKYLRVRTPNVVLMDAAECAAVISVRNT